MRRAQNDDVIGAERLKIHQMAIFGEVLFVEGEIVAPVLFLAFAADCFFLYFVTSPIISIIPIADACLPRYHLMHMSMLGTFFTAAITFLLS